LPKHPPQPLQVQLPTDPWGTWLIVDCTFSCCTSFLLLSYRNKKLSELDWAMWLLLLVRLGFDSEPSRPLMVFVMPALDHGTKLLDKGVICSLSQYKNHTLFPEPVLKYKTILVGLSNIRNFGAQKAGAYKNDTYIVWAGWTIAKCSPILKQAFLNARARAPFSETNVSVHIFTKLFLLVGISSNVTPLK
jgi:hypothetical protein